jgi:hypothetical protein
MMSAIAPDAPIWGIRKKIPDDADRLAAIAEKQIEAFALHHGEAKTPRRESTGHRKKRGYKGLIQKTR